MYGKAAHFEADIQSLTSIDVQSAFASSHCLVLVARVRDPKSLSLIIQFGQAANQKRRVGLLLKLGANIRYIYINATQMVCLDKGQVMNYP